MTRKEKAPSTRTQQKHDDETTPIDRPAVQPRPEVNACPVCGSLFDGIRCAVDGFQTVRS